jgi:hypothetical protein
MLALDICGVNEGLELCVLEKLVRVGVEAIPNAPPSISFNFWFWLCPDRWLGNGVGEGKESAAHLNF